MSASNTTLEELKQEYESKAEAAKKYKIANLIFSLEEADSHYLKLLIERDTAYKPYLRLKVGETSFKHLHEPVIDHRIQRYKGLLRSITGVIV